MMLSKEQVQRRTILSNDDYLVLFTSIVMREVQHPNICRLFLLEVNRHYKLSKVLWKDSEGLISIAETMQKYIKQNLTWFKINTNLKA